jgi:hypothetical protein
MRARSLSRRSIDKRVGRYGFAVLEIFLVDVIVVAFDEGIDMRRIQKFYIALLPPGQRLYERASAQDLPGGQSLQCT